MKHIWLPSAIIIIGGAAGVIWWMNHPSQSPKTASTSDVNQTTVKSTDTAQVPAVPKPPTSRVTPAPQAAPVKPPQQPALQPAHTARSVPELLQRFRAARGKQILFGQQHATDEAISTTANHHKTSDVKKMTGQYPAVFGFDVSESPVEPDRSTAENGKALAAAFRQAANLGAVVTLTDHWTNPITGGDARDTRRVPVRRLLDGGDLNHRLRNRLDIVATAANHARRDDNSSIPIIYRPLHENTGDWFWWGKGHMSPVEYRQLWQYMVNYLRQRTDNIAFAYSPNGHFGGHDHPDEVYLEAYPGDNYVDILGYDAYQSSSDISDAEWTKRTVRDLATVNQLAAQHGKVAAYCEFGLNEERVIQPRHNKNTRFFAPLIQAIQADPQARQIAYMMTWAN